MVIFSIGHSYGPLDHVKITRYLLFDMFRQRI